jgi:hypothetical protein
MFDSICLHNPQAVGYAFDLGILAEAMVFYRHIRVLANAAELVSLLRICGPDSLLPGISFSYKKRAACRERIPRKALQAGTGCVV